jgi:hypothetical protein
VLQDLIHFLALQSGFWRGAAAAALFGAKGGIKPVDTGNMPFWLK